MLDFDLGLFETTLVPAIMVIIQILKGLGVPTKILPVVAIVLGVICGLFFVQQDAGGVVAGILLGATAVGLYSGGKNTVEGFKKN